jgi:hypothetical protein
MFLKKSFGFAKLRLLRLMSLDPGLAKAHFEEATENEEELIAKFKNEWRIFFTILLMTLSCTLHCG